MNIDFVSDVACPWCAVGLHSLERAIDKVGFPVTLRFQPFELNPTLPKEGVDTIAYLTKKYGMTQADVARAHETLRVRGQEVGFTFGERQRVWNTFDAHRLLFWAASQGSVASAKEPGRMTKQRALKHALLRTYHGEGGDVSSLDVLLSATSEAGLDVTSAREVLKTNAHAAEVRASMDLWRKRGIASVPSIIIDEKHLIQGGQPTDLFEQALRDLA